MESEQQAQKKSKKSKKSKAKKEEEKADQPDPEAAFIAAAMEEGNILEKDMASDQWKFYSEKKGVKIYRMFVEGSNIQRVLGVGEVQGTIEDFYEFNHDFDHAMRVSDTMVKETKVLKVVTDRVKAVYASFKMPGRPLIQDRDFTWVNVDFIRGKDTAMSYAANLQKDYASLGIECPELPGYVRGDIQASGYIARKLTDTTLEVKYLVQADPKGWLPVWAVNLAAADQALNVARIADYFAEKFGSPKRADDPETNEVQVEDKAASEEAGAPSASSKKKKKKSKKKKNKVVKDEKEDEKEEAKEEENGESDEE